MITLDTKLLDMKNPENIKQHIINNFNDYELTIQKIRKTKDGFYVYHDRGMEYKRKIRTLIEEGEGYRKYAVSYKKYGVSFIDITDKDIFKDYLTMAIMEALHRKPIE